MKTYATSIKEINREWCLIDAENQILGKVATKAAVILQGKHKVNQVSYIDTGDYVVVLNAAKVAVSGNKEEGKIYHRHSGYPGGYKKQTLGDLRAKRPEEIIRKAVYGMLPKNRLGREMLKKLHIFAGSEHNLGKKELKTLEI